MTSRYKSYIIFSVDYFLLIYCHTYHHFWNSSAFLRTTSSSML